MAAYGDDVYCTLLMSDSYLPGAVVLAHSLRDAGTTKKLAILVTLDSILHDTINELKASRHASSVWNEQETDEGQQTLYDYIITVDKIANPNLENLYKLDRLDLRFAFTKIALWRQQQFRKIVYVDCDVVALRAPDELFDLDADFAAAPDIGWPDIFNSGVMVLKPGMSEYWSLQSLAQSGASFDGADQGLLNEYFTHRPWHRLSFTYNVTPSSSYQYEPAYRHFRSSINMVHFIGKDKPWRQGRQALHSSGSGVYKELLGRWWSVYDRHYRDFYTPSGERRPPSVAVRRYVQDEQDTSEFAWAADGYPQQETHEHHEETYTPQEERSAPFAASQPHSEFKTEEPMSEPGEMAQNIETGIFEPQPTSAMRRLSEPEFVPPEMEWDATRSEPPAESRPEAANFPTTRYEMSSDPHLFQAPQYPDPPKNLQYKIPEIKPAAREPPKPIFPWEQNKSQRKATRVFAEDRNLPEIERPSTPPQKGLQIDPVTPETATSSAAMTPTIKITPTDPWDSFKRTNAWDEVTAIDQYVRALKQSQARRGKVQVVHGSAQPTATSSGTTTPPRRRESLILTDFPTEIERPSLPVTPAPVRKETFWGEERTDASALPTAEGVPEQADWVCPNCGHLLPFPMARGWSPSQSAPSQADPSRTVAGGRLGAEATLEESTGLTVTQNPIAKLEALRRSSLIATEELPYQTAREMPLRAMPGVAAPPEHAEAAALAGSTSAGLAAAPVFSGDTTMSLSQLQQEGTSDSPDLAAAIPTFRDPGFTSPAFGSVEDERTAIFGTSTEPEPEPEPGSKIFEQSTSSQVFTSSSQLSSTTQQTSSSGPADEYSIA